jgi:hypothetical protein
MDWMVFFTIKCMFFSRFEEEIFTTGEVRDTCIPVSSPSDQSMTVYIICGVAVAVSLLAVVAYVSYKSYRKKGNIHCFAGGIRCTDHVTPLYPQKLALTSPTGGGRSVGIVRSRTKAAEFSLVLDSYVTGMHHQLQGLYCTETA